MLTEDGRAFLRGTDEAGLRVTNDLLAPLDPAERETLQALLLRVADQAMTDALARRTGCCPCSPPSTTTTRRCP